jgi:hypothetical protein
MTAGERSSPAGRITNSSSSASTPHPPPSLPTYPSPSRGAAGAGGACGCLSMALRELGTMSAAQLIDLKIVDRGGERFALVLVNVEGAESVKVGRVDSPVTPKDNTGMLSYCCGCGAGWAASGGGGRAQPNLFAGLSQATFMTAGQERASCQASTERRLRSINTLAASRSHRVRVAAASLTLQPSRRAAAAAQTAAGEASSPRRRRRR